MKKIKMFQQTKSSRIALLMEGEKEEVEDAFLSFLNWGAALNTELYETGSENRWYMWTNKKKLGRYFENILEHKFAMRYDHEPSEKQQELIKKLAKNRLDSIEVLDFLPKTRIYFHP